MALSTQTTSEPKKGPLIPVLVLIFVSGISLLLLQSAVNSATGTVPEYQF